jgi:uncharacterized repeat protein (TIGR03837 family)
MITTAPHSSDIFCNVIDNFGDIGVCWRLARQLANEHGLEVRLWVDDPDSFAKLCPEADASSELQKCRGVEVRLWCKEFPDVQPAELVIEAFACKLPQNYLEAMAAQAQQAAWINLEYLSGEDWVESHHKLPSPHPDLPLTKYFFFPGFTRQTGGLLLERDLFERRDEFQRDAAKPLAFWKIAGMEMPSTGTLKISLFSYENAALPGLFDAWSTGTQPVLCLVPEGRIMPQVGKYFVGRAVHSGSDYVRGQLHVRVLPFVEQERYDELLWACDVNFVRGEDSLVRAIWAGRPFVWQIYPQHDAVHLKKLQSFLMLYSRGLSRSASEAVESLWQGWNSGCDTVLAKPADCESSRETASLPGEESLLKSRGGPESEAGKVWPAFAAELGEINRCTRDWAKQLAENNLALNLLDFCGEIGRMRALKIEG